MGECNSATILKLCWRTHHGSSNIRWRWHNDPYVSENAVEKITNLLVSVNESGCTTGDTLFAAYKELSTIIATKKEQKGKEDNTHVVIADEYKSRFDAQVLRHCEEHTLDQFFLWPDTSGAMQKHGQINSQLHSKYEEMRSVMYTEYSDLNKECFMNILAEVITDWATPEKLVKAGKLVGITSKGLTVEWMDQAMFKQAAAVLSPGTPAKTSTDLPGVISPEGVRKNSAAYWKSQYTQAQEQYSTRQQLEFPLEQLNRLLPFKKVKPSATTKKKITDVHGSLKGLK